MEKTVPCIYSQSSATIVNPVFEHAIAKQEADLRVSMPYLRKIAESSASAFLKFGMFSPLALHRKVTAPEVWHLARLGATQAQDCGTCVQVVVNAALNDDVSPSVLQTALSGGDFGPDHQLALDYGRAVAYDDEGVNAIVERVRDRWGNDALVELALAVATTQVFPIVKRGMGLAVSCSLVEIEVAE